MAEYLPKVLRNFPRTTPDEIRECFKRIKEPGGVDNFIICCGRLICKVGFCVEGKAEGLAILTKEAYRLRERFDTLDEKFDPYLSIKTTVIRGVRRYLTKDNIASLDLRNHSFKINTVENIHLTPIAADQEHNLELRELLSGFSTLELTIINLRMEGYNDEEIGKEIGKTQQRVHQLRVAIGNRIKEQYEAAGASDQLKGYLKTRKRRTNRGGL